MQFTSKICHILLEGSFYCKNKSLQNYALSLNYYQPLFNFHLILNLRTLNSYIFKPTPIYHADAHVISITVYLVNIERCFENSLISALIFNWLKAIKVKSHRLTKINLKGAIVIPNL